MVNKSKHISPSEKYCSDCGEIIRKKAEICPKCGIRQHSNNNIGNKDRVVAGIFGILLGSFGVHKFYLGNIGLGVLYLCFFWTTIPGIVGIIEGILYLTMTDSAFKAKYG